MDATGSINSDICVENDEDLIEDSEEKELVTDSCSTKVLNIEQPVDKYCIVYILFYLFGVSSLVPWNFLITANDVSKTCYFDVDK